MSHRYSRIIAVVAFSVGFGGWSDALAANTNPFQLHSSSFAQNGNIPATFTCDGKSVSPPLDWSGAPAKTKNYALIVEDAGAADAKKSSGAARWILYNIPAHLPGLPDATSQPPDARAGLNDRNAVGYHAVCPSAGTHRYIFTLYALDAALKLSSPPTASQLQSAMKTHVLGEATLVGIYKKRPPVPLDRVNTPWKKK